LSGDRFRFQISDFVGQRRRVIEVQEWRAGKKEVGRKGFEPSTFAV
jgi:hypothetical protein